MLLSNFVLCYSASEGVWPSRWGSCWAIKGLSREEHDQINSLEKFANTGYRGWDQKPLGGAWSTAGEERWWSEIGLLLWEQRSRVSGSEALLVEATLQVEWLDVMWESGPGPGWHQVLGLANQVDDGGIHRTQEHERKRRLAGGCQRAPMVPTVSERTSVQWMTLTAKKCPICVSESWSVRWECPCKALSRILYPNAREHTPVQAWDLKGA